MSKSGEMAKIFTVFGCPKMSEEGRPTPLPSCILQT